MKKVPKYIKDKCNQMEKLCDKANILRWQIEEWSKSNGIDICSVEWEENVRIETSGCDAVLDAAEIERLLNENER